MNSLISGHDSSMRVIFCRPLRAPGKGVARGNGDLLVAYFNDAHAPVLSNIETCLFQLESAVGSGVAFEQKISISSLLVQAQKVVCWHRLKDARIHRHYGLAMMEGGFCNTQLFSVLI